MAEEHNYQRSGKKCREKFENLYKYYKKTKEGKAGRQDGKNYRFFRQLEALYGETTNSAQLPDSHFVGDSNLSFQQNGTNNPTTALPMSYEAQQKHYCDSLSLSNTSEFETSASSDDNDDLGSVGIMDNDSVEKRRKRRGGKCWKAKIKQFIDSQMRKLIDKQEAWLEKLMKTLEQKEKDRMVLYNALNMNFNFNFNFNFNLDLNLQSFDPIICVFFFRFVRRNGGDKKCRGWTERGAFGQRREHG